MNTDQISSFIRTILKMVGAWVASKGIADSATIEIIVGGITALAGVVWSWWSARQKNTLREAVEGTVPIDSVQVTNIVPLPAPTITTKSGDTALMQKPNQK